MNDLLGKFNMHNCKESSTPLDYNLKISKELEPKDDEDEEKIKRIPYRELIGRLIHFANATAPDNIHRK